jgi:two-component system response regulator FixJ
VAETIYVIDDDDAVRRSLGFLLEGAGFSARTYAAPAEILAEAGAQDGAFAAGCLVTDIRMPGMNGLELVRHLRAAGVELPVIVITGHGDLPLAIEAMRAGVIDFLEKPFDDEALLTAVRRALDGQAQTHRRDGERRRYEALIAELSPREREVLTGIVAGKLNKVIAHDLGISPRTAEVYRAHLMTKTGARTLSDLVRIGLLGGLHDGD